MITKRNSSEIPKEVFVLFRVVLWCVFFFCLLCFSFKATDTQGKSIYSKATCLNCFSPGLSLSPEQDVSRQRVLYWVHPVQLSAWLHLRARSCRAAAPCLGCSVQVHLSVRPSKDKAGGGNLGLSGCKRVCLGAERCLSLCLSISPCRRWLCVSWGSACPAPGCRIDPHGVCLHAPSPPCKSQIVPIPRCCCHQSPAPSELPPVSLLCPALSQEGPLAREDKLLSLLIIVTAADKLRCDNCRL